MWGDRQMDSMDLSREDLTDLDTRWLCLGLLDGVALCCRLLVSVIRFSVILVLPGTVLLAEWGAGTDDSHSYVITS